MDIKDLLTQRASCRAFTPEPVDRAVIDDVLTRAQRTPSWCNTQPWRVHVLSGEALARFGKELADHALTHEQVADLGLPTYTGVHADRRRESGHALYEHLGIAREDRTSRALQSFRNLQFFDAPHTAILTTDRDLGAYGVVDCGGYVSNLMLLLQDAGLGVIAQGAIAMYSDFVRAHLGLPDERQVVCAVSFGHADASATVNDFRTTRADHDQVVTYLD